MRKPNTKRRKRAATGPGYTLVEMVTVVVIMSIIGLVSTYAIIEGAKIYARTAPSMQASYQARLAIGWLRRDLHDMKDTDSITTFTSTALTFDDTSSNTLAYSLSAGNLSRNGDLLAQGVTSLTFTYWKSDGTTASAAADLHLVEVDLTVQFGDEPYRVRTVVFPRVLSP